MVQGSKEWFDRYFPIVEASKLSLDDEFMRHEPKTSREAKLKRILTAKIRSGLKDFRRSAMNQSINEVDWNTKEELTTMWSESAKKFMPERNSRLGTSSEYVAFLGVRIKYLVNEMRVTVSDAWHAVCDETFAGNLWTARDVDIYMQSTPTSLIDVQQQRNCHILSKDDGSGFLLAGGECTFYNFCDPEEVFCPFCIYCTYRNIYGWIVLDV